MSKNYISEAIEKQFKTNLGTEYSAAEKEAIVKILNQVGNQKDEQVIQNLTSFIGEKHANN